MKKFNQCKKPSPAPEEAAPFFGGSAFFTPGATIQRSPLSKNAEKKLTGGNKGDLFTFLRSKSPLKDADADLDKLIADHFKPDSDDFWLAHKIMELGPEPLWTNKAIVERGQRQHDHNWAPETDTISAVLHQKDEDKIEAFYFPGTSDRRALIIGGVHGSEKAGVDVVRKLLQMMKDPKAPMPLFSVIIVPELFPANVRKGHRKTSKKTRDPNRQFPVVGEDVHKSEELNCMTDSLEKMCVEQGNLILMSLIDRFQPERIASVHGHSIVKPEDLDKRGGAGITTDPRADHKKEDDALAWDMAKAADAKGVGVPFNRLGTDKKTVHYPTNDAAHDDGVSFGMWGSVATKSHPAMNVILIETEGDDFDKHDKKQQKQIESLAEVLRDIFLVTPRAKKP